MTKGTDRLGRTADGNTVCDYDPEEIRRQISISTAVAPLEYKGCKINLLDTPGAFDFTGEVMEALRAADAAIIVCSAKDGISVGFEKVWKYCQERDMPRFIYISKTDEENSDYNATFNACGRSTATRLPPWWCPCGTRTRTPPASSTCSTSAPTRCRTGKRVEIELAEAKRTWSPSSTTL